MLAHDVARARPILEQGGIRDLTLELIEARALALNQVLKIHCYVGAFSRPTRLLYTETAPNIGAAMTLT